jgi:hypothetical protein
VRERSTGNTAWRNREIPSRWLTTVQAADYLGLSPWTLLRKRRVGGGPKFSNPAPRIYRYSLDELDRWLERDNG